MMAPELYLNSEGVHRMRYIKSQRSEFHFRQNQVATCTSKIWNAVAVRQVGVVDQRACGVSKRGKQNRRFVAVKGGV